MPVIFQKFITRQDLRNNPDKIYVFGDNCIREGYGGQAREMRGEPNSIGVRTKFRPDNRPESFFSDSNLTFDICKEYIEDDFSQIEYLLENSNVVVVFPEDGLGTGLSKLPEKAPKLNKFIKNKIKELEEKYNK